MCCFVLCSLCVACCCVHDVVYSDFVFLFVVLFLLCCVVFVHLCVFAFVLCVLCCVCSGLVVLVVMFALVLCCVCAFVFVVEALKRRGMP
jgi:hypothetical protein